MHFIVCLTSKIIEMKGAALVKIAKRLTLSAFFFVCFALPTKSS